MESNKCFIPDSGIVSQPRVLTFNLKYSVIIGVFMRDEQELENTLPALVEAIKTDHLDWLAQHTRLQDCAIERHNKGDAEVIAIWCAGVDLQEK